MFLGRTIDNNSKLIEAAFSMHQKGVVQPDSYIVDVDTLLQNAKNILAEANKNDIRLFFMLKQIGRNPYIARELVKIGYPGAVVVDFKEAQVMMEAGIPICNIGNLVQVPEAMIKEVIAYKPEVITVFSIDKIKSINKVAKELGQVQGIMLRVFQEDDMLYPGQEAGFSLSEIAELVSTIKDQCQNVAIKGVTSFPCYQYDEKMNDILPTNNLKTVLSAVDILKKCGIDCEIINTPSSTCVKTLRRMKEYGGNCGEPGHGFTGTIPMNGVYDMEEIPCVVYLSEVSHNFQGAGYCFGGGHYRRSHVKDVLVGKSLKESKKLEVILPPDDSIDYHLGISKPCKVGDTAVMAFRYQVFVTRSDVVLMRGIQSGNPEVIATYDSLGRKKWENDLL